MDKAEKMHEFINSNLGLLKAAGHHIDFTPNMFMDRKSGFEAVGHALLTIIDAEECKRMIPWPLVKDKAQEREFRTNFPKFIKMINSRYPGAKIPEINASSLQFPGGIKFIEFMYRLSTFALELELKKIMSPKDKEEFLTKPVETEDSCDLQVQLSIIKGACAKEEELILRSKEIESENSSVLKKMTECSKKLKAACKSVSERLKEEVASLDVDGSTKTSLLDMEDTLAITAYNQQVKQKFEVLEDNSRKLKEINDLITRCYKMSQQNPEEMLCLDGRTLCFQRSPTESAPNPLVSVDGNVKLVEVLKSAQTTITRFTRSSTPSDPLLPRAKELQAHSKSAAARARKIQLILRRLLLENQQTVEELQAVVYATVDAKKAYNALFMQELPQLPMFVLPKRMKDQLARESKRRKQRKSFGYVIRCKNKFLFNMRKDCKHIPSPASIKTSACRKLYNRPSSTARKSIKKEKELHVTLELPSFSTPHPPSFIPPRTVSHQPTPVLRSKRKSINDIVERFLRLKQTMNSSLDSRNELDGECSVNGSLE